MTHNGAARGGERPGSVGWQAQIPAVAGRRSGAWRAPDRGRPRRDVSRVEFHDEDLGVLLAGIPGAVRVTRVRASLSHASLDRDLVLQASPDQSELSAVRTVTREAQQPLCPVYQGCESVGTAPRDEASARSGQNSESLSCTVRRAMTQRRGRDALLTAGGFAALALVAAKRLRRKKP